MRNYFFFSIFFVLFLPFSTSAQGYLSNGGNNNLAIVSVPLANVREEPEPKSRIATQVLLADPVRIIEKLDYRYRISIPGQGNLEGWIQQEALLIPRDKGRAYFETERLWIVVSAPKTLALILDKLGNHTVPLYAGTRLPVIEHNESGYTVQFPDRTAAVVSARDVLPIKPAARLFGAASPAELAKTARKFLGVRHAAGGITAQGMDSRGLAYIVYRIHGIDLNMNPDALAARSVKVGRRDIMAGDILVFSSEGLGLAVSNDRFLHAARKTAVQLGGIHDLRFAHSFRYGLRILGQDIGQKKIPAEMTADEIMITQVLVSELPLGKRIAYWAERFIGTPYDPDPLGLYVRTNRIIADEKADCMYHTFRSVELAMSLTPAEAVERALDMRFLHNKGTMVDGLVQNYDDRFQYGEDMVMSGKWGRNITADLGTIQTIPGSRGKETVDILPKTTLITKKLQQQLKDGDIIFWVKDPKKRVVEEIVGHLSIVHLKSGKPYLVHAAGNKDSAVRPGSGAVKEVSFADYVRGMHFIGAFVTRFEQ